MMHEENQLLSNNLPCWNPDCGSSDAVALYGNPEVHVTCFSCGQTSFKEDIVDAYMTGEIELMQPKEKEEEVREYQDPEGTVMAMEDRSILKKTAERYNVKTVFDVTGKRVGRSFPYTDDDGNPIACKNKSLDKKKIFSTGSISRATLFGQHLFSKSSGRAITITEGEEDAMAVHQMMSNDTYETPSVSVKNGAQAAVRDCKQNYEFLNSFENIVICFDMDKPGQEAARKVAELFPGKAKIMKMEHKDANEYLKAGQQNKFKTAWHRAEKVTIQGIYGFRDLWDEMTKEDLSTKVPYPWQEMNDKLYAIRTGELTIIKARPKLGKCFGKGTRVRMWDYSVKNVEDVIEGDLIMGDDGTPRTVSGVTTGTEELFRVDQNKRDSYVVNESHIMCIKHSNTKELRDVPLKEFINSYPNRDKWKGYAATPY